MNHYQPPPPTREDWDKFGEYLASVEARFRHMRDAGVDSSGWDEFQVALDTLERTRKLTPGQFKYLYDRTHETGEHKDYNTHKNYHLKYGNMQPCPVQLIAKHFCNWDIPATKFKKHLRLKLNIQFPRLNLKDELYFLRPDLFEVEE